MIKSLEDLLKLPHGVWDSKFNLYKCPRIYFPVTQEGIEQYNELYQYLYKKIADENGNVKETIMCRRGGVSVDDHNIGPDGYSNFRHNICSMKDWSLTIGGTALFILGKYVFYLHCSNKIKSEEAKKEVGQPLKGYKAFKLFKDTCKKHNVDLSKYEVSAEENLEIKKEICSPLIKIVSPTLKRGMGLGKPIPHCYHIDLHSAYGSGVAEVLPEFRPVIEEIYNLRYTGKDHIIDGELVTARKYYKHVLTNAVGYMQPKDLRFRHGDFYTPISKAGINWTHDTILNIVDNLKKQGYLPLLLNTDGIWYTKPDYIAEPYHDEMEGEGIGKWSTEYADATMRIYGDGKYDFKYIEDGIEQYKPVVRGHVNLEDERPRCTWTWDDNMLRICGEPTKSVHVHGYGIMEVEDYLDEIAFC